MRQKKAHKNYAISQKPLRAHFDYANCVSANIVRARERERDLSSAKSVPPRSSDRLHNQTRIIERRRFHIHNKHTERIHQKNSRSVRPSEDHHTQRGEWWAGACVILSLWGWKLYMYTAFAEEPPSAQCEHKQISASICSLMCRIYLLRWHIAHLCCAARDDRASKCATLFDAIRRPQSTNECVISRRREVKIANTHLTYASTTHTLIPITHISWRRRHGRPSRVCTFRAMFASNIYIYICAHMHIYYASCIDWRVPVEKVCQASVRFVCGSLNTGIICWLSNVKWRPSM